VCAERRAEVEWSADFGLISNWDVWFRALKEKAISIFMLPASVASNIPHHSSSILYPSGTYGSQRAAAAFNLNTQESEGFDLSGDKA